MTNHGETYRTLIVDPDPLVRVGLSEALSRDGSFVVIADLASPPARGELLAHGETNLVLLSGFLLQSEAVEAVTEAVAAEQQVVVYGGQGCDTSLVSAVLAAGCSAYLSTQRYTPCIASAITNLLAAKYTPAALSRAAGSS
jgi:DNA-binding NarL/FixJ family response regulator